MRLFPLLAVPYVYCQRHVNMDQPLKSEQMPTVRGHHTFLCQSCSSTSFSTLLKRSYFTSKHWPLNCREIFPVLTTRFIFLRILYICIYTINSKLQIKPLIRFPSSRKILFEYLVRYLDLGEEIKR